MTGAQLDPRAIAVELVTAASGTSEVYRACGELHGAAISGGFMSTLGPEFLANLYRALASSPESFLFVAKLNGRVVGLIVGSSGTGVLMRSLILRQSWRFLPYLWRIAFRRETFKKIMEVVFYPLQQSFDDLPDAEIINFCVAGDVQGSGVGGRLFAALDQEFQRRHVDCIRIVTGEEQHSAQAFYRSAGAKQAGEVSVHEGASSKVFVYKIGSPASPPGEGLIHAAKGPCAGPER